MLELTFVASLHHHLVAVAVGVVGLILLILVIVVSKGRTKQVTQQPDELQAQRIQDRLASGYFSRKPSGIRPKVADAAEPQHSAHEDEHL